jgi:hypothetical protein
MAAAYTLPARSTHSNLCSRRRCDLPCLVSRTDEDRVPSEFKRSPAALSDQLPHPQAGRSRSVPNATAGDEGDQGCQRAAHPLQPRVLQRLAAPKIEVLQKTLWRAQSGDLRHSMPSCFLTIRNIVHDVLQALLQPALLAAACDRLPGRGRRARTRTSRHGAGGGRGRPAAGSGRRGGHRRRGDGSGHGSAGARGTAAGCSRAVVSL